MNYSIETAVFNKEAFACKSNLVVSIVLKIEIILAVVWFFEYSVDLAIALGAVCAFTNQLTEVYYFKSTMQRQKLLILFKSLLVTLCFYLAAYLIHVSFIYHRHGETRIDTNNVWLIAKVLVFLFFFLAAERILAMGADALINRIEHNKKLKKIIPNKPVSS